MKTTALVLIFLFAQVGSAQEICAPHETVNGCFSRLFEPQGEASKEASKEIEAQAPNEMWQQLIGKATGLNVPDLGLESATEDFLPLLRLAFAAAGLGDSVDRSALGFERRIGAFGANHSWELKFKSTMNEVEVYAPLKAAFSEQVREQRVNDLKAELRDFDDYSLTLELNRSSENYGRTPNSYSQEVFRSLLAQVVDTAKITEAQGLRLLDILKDLKNMGVTGPDKRTFEELKDLEKQGRIPAKTVEKVEQGVAAAAKEGLITTEDLKKKAAELSIFKVADLLNNQPQINGSGTSRLRKGAAGPDEIMVKASYEYGLSNLNGLRRVCGRPNGALDTTFADCYSSFMKNNQGHIEHGDKFSFTAEYNKVDAFRFSLPADHIDLNLDSQDGLVLTLAYGRLIDISLLGDDNSRIDVSGKYESKDDRGVISLTYTNRLLKSLGGSIGISYANHERFLPKSGRVLSAHFGVSFNSFTKNPPKTSPESP